jgi:hypothetical protein
MRQERLEERARVAESEVKAVLQTPTQPSDATAALTRLHSAFDIQRRCQETLALAREASRSRPEQ